MDLTHALMVALAFSCCADASDNILTACPSESTGHSYIGFRTKRDRCVTVIFRGQVINSKMNSSIPIYERAKLYCKAHFKLGTLVSHNEFKHAARHLESIGLFDSEQNDTWQAALCLHDTYANCVRKGKNKCVYVPERRTCLWQHTYIEVQAQEMPFGRQCQAIEGNGHACDCSRCTTTDWSPWSNYTHHLGFTFRTRYRPEDTKPCHSCYADSDLCCVEHEVSSAQNISSIPCLNGGTIDPWLGVRCKCRANFSGAYCEIRQDKQQPSEFKVAPINLTVPQAMALLLIWTAATILACLLCAGGFKSLSSYEKKPLGPSVVVNIRNMGDNDKALQAGAQIAAKENIGECIPHEEDTPKRETDYRSSAEERHDRQAKSSAPRRRGEERLYDGRTKCDGQRTKAYVHLPNDNGARCKRKPKLSL